MLSVSRIPFAVGAVIVLIGALGLLFFISIPTPVRAPHSDIVVGEHNMVTLKLGQTGAVNDVTLTPEKVVEDSRCPSDVQCIQAGRARVRATIVSGLGTSTANFLVGEPITTEAEQITLVEVTPYPHSKTPITKEMYRFVFLVEKRGVVYQNASAELVKVTTPTPLSVVGKTFEVKGQARGQWFFEASFPVSVLDMNGVPLVTVVAQAEGEWMTEEFVPFTAKVVIPETYVGRATILLKKDNPSGMPEKDGSLAFPVTIEY